MEDQRISVFQGNYYSKKRNRLCICSIDGSAALLHACTLWHMHGVPDSESLPYRTNDYTSVKEAADVYMALV